MQFKLPSEIHTRMAPTPSGYLHIGNILNFLFTWLIARAKDGTVRLRIDDMDQGRVRDEYLEDIFESLDWLGIDWDEGPSDTDQAKKQFSQTFNLPEYEELLQYLVKEKYALFACAKSRKDIQAGSTDGQYPLAFRDQGLPIDTKGAAWRIKTKEERQIWEDVLMGPQSVNLCQEMRDFVVRKKDGFPAYQLVSVADDEADEITFIVRGEDLRLSTAAQLFLAKELDFTGFPKITLLHHPLLSNSEGKKLSKSEGAISLKYMREQGMPITRILKFAARVFGLPVMDYVHAEELWDQFDPENISWNMVDLSDL